MTRPAGCVVFGEFEFDRLRHELRRAGHRVPLQEQPFQILDCLLERADELVTRDELRDRLWPQGVYVEYAKSINVAMMKLRDALGDSAEAPRFIATLPRLGYRFIAPVEIRSPAPESSEVEVTAPAEDRPESAATVPVAVPEGTTPGVAPAVARAEAARRTWRRVLVVVLFGAVALAVGRWAWHEGARRAPTVRSLAVLPFADQSPRIDEEYLAAGLTEELIHSLAQIGTLKVTSRTSSLALRGSKDPLSDQARRLGVDAVVEGSVSRVGSRVRVTAQLVHGASDRHLWTGRYEREEDDILDLQNEIARDIAREIAVGLGPEEERRLARRRSLDPEAYREYLRGCFHRHRRSVDGYVKAVRHFRRAIEIEPGFAAAHAGIGLVYFDMGFLGVFVADEANGRARGEAEEALRLDPELSEAHALLGFVLAHGERRWRDAEAELARARELGPSESTAFAYTWLAFAAQGRHREALAEGRRMFELDPLNPVLSEAIAYVEYLDRDFPAAIGEYRRAVELDPGRQSALQGLANAQVAAGAPEAALESYVRWAEVAGFEPGDVEELRRRFAEEESVGIWRFLLGLEERDEEETGQVWPYRRASLHARLGDADAAFRWLEEAVAENAPQVIYLGSEPAFDGVRRDPRFAGYLGRLNLDPKAFATP